MAASRTRPARIAGALERWFARNQRPLPWRDRYESYHVWVSEVMLQQTRMEVVLRYFPRFLERFPDVHALAEAAEEDVLAAWSGLGYYRRARMLHQGAKHVVANCGGRLPADAEALRTVPGIGRYTAGAIASIAFDLPAPIVDGNVARLLARVEATAGDVWPFAEALARKAASPRAMNQGMMEVGSLVCRPRNPLCGVCPLARLCGARREGTIDQYPPRRRRPESIATRLPVTLALDARGHVLLQRRDGMLHLPRADASGTPLGTFRHTVMNRRITFELFSGLAEAVGDGGGEFEWVDPARLSEYPHPSYVRKALAVGRRPPAGP